MDRPKTHREMADFFLPLALTSLIIVISHSAVNAGIARARMPEVSLAAYALAKSFVILIENPMFMVRQTTASLATDKVSLYRLTVFMGIIAIVVTVILALIGFTPLGDLVVQDIIGASGDVAHYAKITIGILCLLPLATYRRNMFHGIAMIFRQTKMVPFSTTIRLIVMAGLVFAIGMLTGIPGAYAAGIAFVTALIVEAVLMYWLIKGNLREMYSAPVSKDSEELSYNNIAKFFFPLFITTTLTTATIFIINAFLARSPASEVLLASFAVGFDLSHLFIGPVGMLHQCVLTFAQKFDSKYIKEFSLGFGVIISILLLIVAYSPMGMWLITNVIGVKGITAHYSLIVIKILTFLPIIRSCREFLWGDLMSKRNTGPIGRSKITGILTIIVILILGAYYGPDNWTITAALAIVLGEIAEILHMVIDARHKAIRRGRVQEESL